MVKLTVQTAAVNGQQITFKKVKSDVYGNPRIVVHYLSLGLDDFESVPGFTRYRGNDFGGGYVFQSYNHEDTLKWAAEAAQAYLKEKAERLEKVNANIYVNRGGAASVINQTGYKFIQQLHGGGAHDFFVSRALDGWFVHDYATGLYIHGGSSTRKGMLESFDRYVLKTVRLTKETIAAAVASHEILNK